MKVFVSAELFLDVADVQQYDVLFKNIVTHMFQATIRRNCGIGRLGECNVISRLSNQL
jgi:hypothetical protein